MVNGYGAIFGRAAVSAASSVDLPAFGSPTRPTSAMRRSSSRSQRSAPGSPFWAWRGVRWVAVAKWTLPRPPRPPRATGGRLAGGDEVREELARGVVEHAGPGRNGQDQVVAGLAVALGAQAPSPGLGPEVVLEPEVAERRQAGVHLQHDAAAAAAVAPVGPAAGDVRLAAERGGPVAAVAGADPDLDAVEEHLGDCRTGAERGRSATLGRARPQARDSRAG